MNKIIAFCTDAKVFNNNQILDYNVASRFPGSLWVSILAKKTETLGINIYTGDVVINEVLSGNYKISDVYIIQEENSIHGQKLQKLGAKPFLIFCGESPIFANYFYKEIAQISKNFKIRILFSGILKNNINRNLDLIYYFPSFDSKTTHEIINWHDRKFLVMVSANKYWKTMRLTFSGILRGFFRKFRNLIFNRNTEPQKAYSDKNLHDTRLELIEYFGNIEKLDLFGNGWDDLKNLPFYWQKRLTSIVKKINPLPVIDKITVISHYKFAICLENMIYEGYVTEKIIDCLRAGVIPIYLGAPNIQDYIPQNLFIDMRNFKNINELNHFLLNITDVEAIEMIKNAQLFLQTENGLKFSYNAFAENVYQLIYKHIIK